MKVFSLTITLIIVSVNLNVILSIECVVESLDELYARVYATVDNTSSHLTPNHGCQPCLSLLSVKLFCAWSYAALMIVLLQMSR